MKGCLALGFLLRLELETCAGDICPFCSPTHSPACRFYSEEICQMSKHETVRPPMEPGHCPGPLLCSQVLSEADAQRGCGHLLLGSVSFPASGLGSLERRWQWCRGRAFCPHCPDVERSVSGVVGQQVEGGVGTPWEALAPRAHSAARPGLFLGAEAPGWWSLACRSPITLGRRW